MHERFNPIILVKDATEARQAERDVGAMVDRFGRDLLYVAKKYLRADCVDPEAPDADGTTVEAALVDLKARLANHRVNRIVGGYRAKRLRGEENDVSCRRPGITVYLAAGAAGAFNRAIPSQKRSGLPQPQNAQVSSVRLADFGYHIDSDRGLLCFDDLKAGVGTETTSKSNFSFSTEYIVCVVGDYGDFWQNPDSEMVEFTKALDE